MKNRRESRETVFAILFEWSFKEDQTLDEILENATEARDIVIDKFAERLLRTAIEHKDEIDKAIETHSEKWKINRISSVSLACLRMAMCELMYFPDIPEGATINEAIELVKEYGGEDESGYINGILGGYTRQSSETKES